MIKQSDIYSLIGPGLLRTLIDDFHARLSLDPRVEPYFPDDTKRLKAHTFDLLSGAFGGPDEYAGRDLTAVHAEVRHRVTGTPITLTVGYLVGNHLVSAVMEAGASMEICNLVTLLWINMLPVVVPRVEVQAPPAS